MPEISQQDVAQVVQLIAEASDPSLALSTQERRFAIIQSLGWTIKADVWNWVAGTINPDLRGDAMASSSFDGGFRDDAERASFFRISIHPDLASEVMGMVHDAVVAEIAITRSRRGLLPDEKWMGSPGAMAYGAAGFGDFVLSAYPLGASTYSAIGYHRRSGRPNFSAREVAIVHAVFQNVPWLHATRVPAVGKAAINLSPRERQVLIFLMGGDPRKIIAAKLGISQHTVTGYLKELYRKFDVSSRAELLAKLRGEPPSLSPG